MLKIAKERGLNIVKTFKESLSAKKPGRPGYNEMVGMIKQGDADAVLCWSINRLTRCIDEGGPLQGMLQRKILRRIVTYNHSYYPTDNIFRLLFEFGMANQFILDLSRDVKRGMLRKCEKGYRPGKATLGYINDRGGLKGEKEILIDPERFHKVREMWDLLLSGQYGVKEIWEKAEKEWKLTRKGSNTIIGKSTLYNIFTNPFYYGEFQWDDTWYKGAHVPMITQEEFELAQAILGAKGKPRQRKYERTFTGLIRCGECGCMVTAEPPKIKQNKGDKKIRVYHYLRCTKKNPDIRCSQSYLRVKHLEKQIDSLLKTIEVPQCFIDWAFKELRAEVKKDSKTLSSKRAQLQKAFTANDAMSDVLLKKLLKGTIDDETYKKNIREFERNSERLKEELEKYSQDKTEWLREKEKEFLFAKGARNSFAKGDRKKKREIFYSLGSNFVLKDKELQLELKRPFRAIQSAVSMTEAVLGSLEPIKNGLGKLKEAQREQLETVWSG